MISGNLVIVSKSLPTRFYPSGIIIDGDRTPGPVANWDFQKDSSPGISWVANMPVSLAQTEETGLGIYRRYNYKPHEKE